MTRLAGEAEMFDSIAGNPDVWGDGATRVDMHCHSSASAVSRLGVQRTLGLPECATPPEEVYELAKRRGMDFVTITDHDTIDGVMEIADRPDVFVSEELTARFRGESQAVHVPCYGIDPEDHGWLQAHSHDVELCAGYLHEREIACALAHPWYAVGTPLTARHRRRLAELFDVWETRNGSRAHELNRPAAIYVATSDGTGIGGSDDHAGIDIGRTWTEAPPATTPAEFLAHMRAGRVAAKGRQGSAAKWAHSAIALAARSLGHDDAAVIEAPDPQRVMLMIQRVLSEGDSRFDPALRSTKLREGWMRDATGRETEPHSRINVMYAGRITREKGAELLADSFLAALEHDPRLHLVLAGEGPEQERLRERLGEHATFLGWLRGHGLAQAYASADVFLFPSSTDTFGQVILEAQASGLPVVAVAKGGPLTLIEDRVTGLLCEAGPALLADAVLELAGSPLLRRSFARAARAAALEHTWERALERLAHSYRLGLSQSAEQGRLVA